MITLLRVIEGLALLTLGRKLFWLFVAAIGFEVGALLATRLMPQQSDMVVLIIALAFGLVGALLAISLQSVIVGVVGFIAGGVVAVGIMDQFIANNNVFTLAAFVLGGIVGAALFAYLFDFAIMALSSLAGAITLTNIFVPPGTIAIVVIIILFIIGMAIQSGWIWYQQRRTV
ncbi:MAG: hypothetical protein HZB51_31095 [Chloroflexi bacterium]|nr:hypothetical protein [Chloroflexota bacterium]